MNTIKETCLRFEIFYLALLLSVFSNLLYVDVAKAGITKTSPISHYFNDYPNLGDVRFNSPNQICDFHSGRFSKNLHLGDSVVINGCTVAVATCVSDEDERTYGSAYKVDVCGRNFTDAGSPDSCDNHCVRNDGVVDPEKNAGEPPCKEKVGSPINVATGNKFLTQIDSQGNGPMPLSLIRTYNSSLSLADDIHGAQWALTFDRRIKRNTTEVYDTVFITRGSGRGYYYSNNNGVWETDIDVEDVLTELTDINGLQTGWQYVTGNDNVELYDINGRLQSITDPRGNTQTFIYDSLERLESVSNNIGQSFAFTYLPRVEFTYGAPIDPWDTVTDHAGRVWSYGYDENLNLSIVTNPDNTTRQYEYNDPRFLHALTAVIDERDQLYTHYAYDDQGRGITTSKVNNVERIDIIYNADNTRTVTDALGQVSTYTTTVQRGTARITDIDGTGCSSCSAGDTRFNYDSENRLMDKAEKGLVTEYGDYNAKNDVGYKIISPDTSAERRIDYSYIGSDNDASQPWQFRSKINVVTEPSVCSNSGSFKVTTTEYDVYGNPLSLTVDGYTPDCAATSRSTHLEYNGPLNQLSQIDGPREDVADITALTYYPNDEAEGSNRARLKTVTNALGQTVTYNGYNAIGSVLQMTDANGNVTDYSYDIQQRVVSQTVTPSQGTPRTTTYSYDGVGQLLSTTTPANITLTYSYDAARYLRSVSDNIGNQIEYNYDLKGNRTQEITKDSDGVLERLVDSTYDERDRVSSINAAGSLTSLVYDSVGNLTGSTDPNSNTTTNSYDSLNRLMQSVDELAGTTGYDYDANDRVVAVTAPNNAQTTYTYDDLGNLLTETSSDRGTRNYTYNAAGNLIALTDARNITVNYSYDALGRVTSIDYPKTLEDISFSYDVAIGCTNGIGRLCGMTDESGITNYAYDGFGNIISQNRTELGITYTTGYSYDAGDNITSMTYPGGRVVTMERDIINRISAITATVNGAQKTLVSDVQYRADNLKTAQTFGNDITESRTYDLQGRLIEQGSNVGAIGVPNGVTVSLLSSVPSPSPIDASITFTAQASDTGVYEYQFSLQGPSTNNIAQVASPYSLNNAWIWNSSNVDEGDSTISVEMRVAGSVNGATQMTSMAYTIGTPPVESVTLSASQIPTVAGQSTQFTASAVGGSGSTEYRFTVQSPSTNNIPQVVQNYSINAIFDWSSTSTDVGDSTITVDARNVGAAQDSEATASQSYTLVSQVASTGVTLTADLPSPQKAGTTITFTAQATGGNVGEYEYRFSRYFNGAYIDEIYGPSNTYTLATTEADSLGGHSVYVYARNKGSSVNFDSYTYQYMTIQTGIEPLTGLTGSIASTSPISAGTNVVLTAQASGGNVGEYEYYFSHQAPGWVTTTTTYGPSNTYTIPTTEADSIGRHYVYIYARNKGSTASYESYAYKYFDVKSSIIPVSSVSLVSDIPATQLAGATFNFTAQAAGGTGNYEYYFSHTGPDTGGAYVNTTYSSSASYTLATNEASVGVHYVIVYARTVGSTKAYDVSKYVRCFINSSTAILDNNFRHVGLNLPDKIKSSNQTQVAIVRNTAGDGYNYWVKSRSSNQQWQQLSNATELGTLEPDTMVYVDKGYLDVWYRSDVEDSAYRYQRISAPIHQRQQVKPARFIKTAAGDPILATRSYSYDANGNVLNITKPDGIHSYGYDALDRIVNDAQPSIDVIGLNYDANGNRTSDTQGAESNVYGIGAGSNRLDAVNGQTVSRDVAGNTLADSSPLTGGTRTFEYSKANRLFKVYEAGGLVATYTYNALGQRTRKVTPTGTTVYHYDLQGQLIAETQADGRPIRDVVWQGIEPVAQIDVDGANETVTYLHTDHLATPRSATDETGAVVWSWNSDAFGSTAATGSVTVNLRFPGQYYDSETQLHYNWNRYYDPRVGRYITSDPIGLRGGLNTYGYVGGNPVYWIDPTGLDWVFDRGAGTITQTDSNGNPGNSWPAGSGPWGNGQLPAGDYTLPGPPVPVPSSHPNQSSYCDGAGNCWWQPTTPNFPTNRTGLGIHPDGNVPGTAGCIGATDNDTTSLRDALMNDQGPLTVR